MSLKQVLETLATLGLNRSDANVYVYLAKKGPHTGKDLCNVLHMSKPCLYQCLKNLVSRGVVTTSSERPALFSAVPFEKVLDFVVKAKLEEAQRTQAERDKAVSQWQFLFEEDVK